MKPHYHVNVTSEMRQDLRLWQEFLNHPTVYSRPFLDFSSVLQADDIDFYTDSSGSIGCGSIFGDRFFQL